jgi:hypothetical protein
MAIKIPIITVFDNKGLKQAQYQLNKVSGNFQNLGRNAAIAGVAFGAAAIGLSKSVKVASDLGESINAINVSFGKSAQGILAFGQTASTTLGLSQVEFNNAAVRFSGFADKIVGAGNDSSKFIEQITTRAADFASVYNIDVADALERFQSGLAGQTEPLAKFGVNLLDSEVKAYAVRTGIAELGTELTATQKTQARFGLLMESTNKTAGDFANTSDSLANGMRILQAQVTDVQGEIGKALLPVLQEVLPVLRDLVTEFGDKLKTAVESVDWKGLITDFMNLLTFIVQNIDAIVKVVTTMYLLNTAFNVGRVAIGLYNGVAALLNGTLFVTATRAPVAAAGVAGVGVVSGTASIGVGLLAGAMRLVPWAALATWIGFVIQGMTEVDSAYRQNTPTVTSFGTQVLKTGKDSEWAAKKYGVASQKVGDYANSANAVNGIGFAGHRRSIGQIVAAWKVAQQAAKNYKKIVGAGLGGATADRMEAFLGGGKKKKKKKDSIFDFSAPTKQLDKLKKLKKDVEKKVAKSEEDSGLSKKELAAQAEAEALEKRKQNYQSFLDSVKSTFGQIRDGILSSFSLPELGGSTDSIIRNMGKLLGKTKEFASNISTLSSMGLNATLLQQVISQGPIAGAKLAASLVSGGVAGLAAINAGYAEMGALSSQIATTGTTAAYGSQAQQNVFNIEVNGGLATGPAIGQAIVEAITAYERTSGVVWTRA